MRRVISAEKLPPEYGGTGPAWLGPDLAETLEDQVGELAAAVYVRAGVVPAGARPWRHGAAKAGAGAGCSAGRPSPRAWPGGGCKPRESYFSFCTGLQIGS